MHGSTYTVLKRGVRGDFRTGDVQLKALAVYFRRDIYCLQYRMQPVADGTVRANNNTKVFYHDPTIFPVARLSERRGNIIELRDFYASIPFERVERVLSTITHNRADRTKPILISHNGETGETQPDDPAV